jgi:hypothetical protein
MASQNDKTGYIMEHEDENKRLTYNHELYKDSMGGQLHFAPVDWEAEPPKSVLDTATADGTPFLYLPKR